jgi:2-methylcitrate dehydratase PrpD
MGNSMRTILEKISDYIVSSQYRDFSKLSIQKAKLCLLDFLGCAIGGTLIETGKILLRFSESMVGDGSSTILGGQRRVSCTNAALINSLLGNCLDFDDTYAGAAGHPGATVIPTVLSVGEERRSSGREALIAILVGYEITIRLLISMRSYVSRETLYGHGTPQTLGVAAAAGKLLGLDVKQMSNALAIAGSTAPVPSVMKTVYNRLGPSMAKNNYGAASVAGIVAAFLAREGFTGPLNLLEGETGFWKMCGATGCDFDAITSGLGNREAEILNVGFKSYPACWLIQPSIEAAAVIAHEHCLSPESITQIAVRTIPLACEWPFSNKKPNSPVEAQFSLPYSIAVIMLGVTPGPAWFAKELLGNPLVLSLAEKVKLVPDRGMEDAHRKGSPIQSEVQIVASGKCYSQAVGVVPGHPCNPLSPSQLESKFKHLASAVLGMERCDRIIAQLKSFEQLDDLRKFMDLMRPVPC